MTAMRKGILLAAAGGTRLHPTTRTAARTAPIRKAQVHGGCGAPKDRAGAGGQTSSG